MTDARTSAPDASGSQPTAIGSGRAGKIRARFRDLIAEARRDNRMTTEHELVAALAEKVAALVDTSAAKGDAAGMLRAVNTLRDLLDTLPIRDVRGEVNPGDGSGAGAELRSIIRSAPTVGNAADA